MKKRVRNAGCLLALAMGLTLLAGCGKKDGFKNSDELVDKYASMCELGEYKGVEYDAYVTEVTDDMVQSQIDMLLDGYKAVEYKDSGTARNGDTVNIDFVGSIDGVEFSGGSTNGGGYDLELGVGLMIDGFEEQIVGHDVGEVFDINVTFPEDYGNTDLAGQDAVFEITINSIVVTTYPDYTDAFVASNTDCATIDEYEAQVRTNLEEQYAKQNENQNKSAIMEVVIGNAVVNEYPKQEMEELVEENVNSTRETAKSYGYELETYVSLVYGMSSEDVFKQFISQSVENYMTEKIVVCAIAKAEDIRVDKDEINDYKEVIKNTYGYTSDDQLYEYYDNDDIMYYALADKVVTFLLENAVPVMVDDIVE